MNEINLQLELSQIMAAKYDDFQEVRKSAANRIRNVVFRKDKGIGFRELQEKKNKTDEEKEWLSEYTDAKLSKKIKGLITDGKITNEETKFIEEMLNQLEESKTMEKRSKKILTQMIGNDELYVSFISRVKGLNIMSMARILYYFGHCEKATYPSSLWAYAGYTPDSKHEKGKSSNFNSKCRVEMYKIGKNLIRSNFITLPTNPDKKEPGRYRKVYDVEKERQINLLENDPDNEHAPKRKGHADMRALRKMVKNLLADYYRVCKSLANEPQTKPYVIEKLGHAHFDDIMLVLENNPDQI